MAKEIMKIVNDIDCLISNNDYREAFKQLEKLLKQYPNEGIIHYYMGKLLLLCKNDELALIYFTQAEKLDYISDDLYFLMAGAFDFFNNDVEAEKYYIKAEKLSDNADHTWVILSALTVFYIKHNKYLKAEKKANKILELYPDNYQGYHLHVVIKVAKKYYDEALVYISKIPVKFQNHPQLLIDYVNVYRQSGRDGLIELFERDSRFIQFVPQEVLKEKLKHLSCNEKIDENKKVIIKLAQKYHNSDAFVSLMVLNFANQNFEVSSKIASVVLDNEKNNQGLKFYLALYFQIFNLYFLSGKKPSTELRKWIYKSGKWCVDYIDNLHIAEIGDLVRASISSLFKEINEI